MSRLIGLAALSAFLAFSGVLFGDGPHKGRNDGHPKPPPPAFRSDARPTPPPAKPAPPTNQLPAPDRPHHNPPPGAGYAFGGQPPHHGGPWHGDHRWRRYPYYYGPVHYLPWWWDGIDVPYLSSYDQPSFYPVNPPLRERESEPQPPPGQANLAPFGNQPNVEKPEPSERATNRQSVALAWKFLGYGDKNFALKKFPDAVDRYRKAVEAAPQLADAYFRLGFAQTALGRYESAAKSMRRGLELDPKWPQSGFKLDTLFAGNDDLKIARLEALVKASEKNATDGDVLFLAGIHLYFDGQQDRADPFFQLARQIYVDAEPINAFLRAQEKEE